MDDAVIDQLVDLDRRGEWEEGLAVTTRLLASLETRPSSPERDARLAHVFEARAHFHAVTGGFPAAVADGRRALDILYRAEEPDEMAIASVLHSHVQLLAELGDAEAIGALDHNPMVAYRAALDACPPGEVSIRVFMARQLVGYANGMHMVGEHELACACDRQALAVLRQCVQALGPDEWSAYSRGALNLSEATPDAAEAKAVADEAVHRLTGLMNAGRFGFLLPLVRAVHLLGVAGRRLGEDDAARSFVTAEYLLDLFRPDDPEAAELAEAIDGQLTPEERQQGWYVDSDLARMSGDWYRRLRAQPR
ncbi:hypothetical protein ACTWP5_26445 [Streptomyces sp. 4N509B]|uniref:hypothetical protein n=1 Tax=Streptomyces sp. 4N509B TaxID=3457413 RepID=UPI003FD20FB1